MVWRSVGRNLQQEALSCTCFQTEILPQILQTDVCRKCLKINSGTKWETNGCATFKIRMHNTTWISNWDQCFPNPVLSSCVCFGRSGGYNCCLMRFKWMFLSFLLKTLDLYFRNLCSCMEEQGANLGLTSSVLAPMCSSTIYMYEKSQCLRNRTDQSTT